MPYFGKPENQRNPKATRVSPSDKDYNNPATSTKMSNPNPQPKAPPALAKPTHLQVKPFKKDLKEHAPNQDAVFSKDTNLYEVAPKATFTPTFSSFNAVVSQIYQTYAAKNVLTAKTLSPGMLNYYLACMTWFRITIIKANNAELLTPTEKTILELIKNLLFSIPKPFSIYLKSVGNISSATEQTLVPELPPYPVDANGHSMWSQEVNNLTHAFFELYPTVGVAAEVLQAELTPTNIAWAPSVVPATTTPTNNLQGYLQPVEQKQEIKQIIIGSGVTQHNIGSTIPNADINIPLLQSISSAIDRLDVFSNESTSFLGSEINGSQSQLIKITATNPGPTSIATGEVSISDYTRDSAGTVGMAITYQTNVVREGRINNNDHYLSWSSIRNGRNQPPVVDANWYNNRNGLRNYPPQYDVNIFTTGSRNATVFRSHVFEELAK